MAFLTSPTPRRTIIAEHLLARLMTWAMLDSHTITSHCTPPTNIRPTIIALPELHTLLAPLLMAKAAFLKTAAGALGLVTVVAEYLALCAPPLATCLACSRPAIAAHVVAVMLAYLRICAAPAQGCLAALDRTT